MAGPAALSLILVASVLLGCAAVVDRVGIAYAPTWLFQDLIASGDVQVLMPGWEPSPLPLHLVSPPERRHSAKVRAFSEHLSAALVDPTDRPVAPNYLHPVSGQTWSGRGLKPKWLSEEIAKGKRPEDFKI